MSSRQDVRRNETSCSNLVGAIAGTLLSESGWFGRPWSLNVAEKRQSRESSHVRHRTAADLQPPGMVQSRRAIGRTDRAGRSPNRRGADARRRRRPDRAVANRADAAVYPVRDSRRIARRPHFAARADGGLGSAARRGAARNSRADLVQPADLAAARAARLCRGMRNGRLQRGGAGAGAVIGAAAIAAFGQCADRAGAHHRIRQWTGLGRRAGRMGRRRTGVWM